MYITVRIYSWSEALFGSAGTDQLRIQISVGSSLPAQRTWAWTLLDPECWQVQEAENPMEWKKKVAAPAEVVVPRTPLYKYLVPGKRECPVLAPLFPAQPSVLWR